MSLPAPFLNSKARIESSGLSHAPRLHQPEHALGKQSKHVNKQCCLPVHCCQTLRSPSNHGLLNKLIASHSSLRGLRDSPAVPRRVMSPWPEGDSGRRSGLTMRTGRADHAAIPPFWSLHVHGMRLSSSGFPAQSAIVLEACTDKAVVTSQPTTADGGVAAGFAAVERECRSRRKTTVPTLADLLRRAG